MVVVSVLEADGVLLKGLDGSSYCAIPDADDEAVGLAGDGDFYLRYA